MILIDTTPLVALCDSRDAKHRLAVTHLQMLASDRFGTSWMLLHPRPRLP